MKKKITKISPERYHIYARHCIPTACIDCIQTYCAEPKQLKYLHRCQNIPAKYRNNDAHFKLAVANKVMHDRLIVWGVWW